MKKQTLLKSQFLLSVDGRSSARVLRFALVLTAAGALCATQADAQSYVHITSLYNPAGIPASDLQSSESPIVFDNNHDIFGTTMFGGKYQGGMLWERTPDGSLYDLHDFGGGAGDGADPSGSLAIDAQGNIYGTTQRGGSSFDGIIWEWSPATIPGWAPTYAVLHTFGVDTISYSTGNGSGYDGGTPYSGVLLTGGTLIGTASAGGAFGGGLIWKLTSSGAYSDLHDFGGTIRDAAGQAGMPDGTLPEGNLMQDKTGAIYGTTMWGGPNSAKWRGHPVGAGMLWRLTSSLTYTDLHDFGGKVKNVGGATVNDGFFSDANVAEDAAGNLYGTAMGGGANDLGIAWKLTPGNAAYVDLHDFGGAVTDAVGVRATDGNTPTGNVTLDAYGDLYGTTSGGGPGSPYMAGSGNIWKIASNNVYQDVHDFGGTAYGITSLAISDGVQPAAGVSLDENGNVYGTTTAYGGAGGNVWVLQGSPVIGVNQSWVDGGNSALVQVNVELMQPAPICGAIMVNLGFSLAGFTDPHGNPLPSTITFAPGTSGVSFTALAPAVASEQVVKITGAVAGTKCTGTLADYPSIAVSNFTISGTSLSPSSPVTGTITLNGPAPAGYTVQVADNSTWITLSTNRVVFANGQQAATFTITATPGNKGTVHGEVTASNISRAITVTN